jgi:alkylation response protein AidB-like acyl-CoA dehydrogenase
MPLFAPEEDQRLIIDTARAFSKDKLRPALRRAERAGAPDESLRREYAGLGFGGLEIPEAQGGAGLGATTAALAAEELAYGDAGLSVALHGPGSFDVALLALGSPAQQADYLGPFAADPLLRGALAFADGGPAPSRPGLATRAQRDGAGWRLTGRKGLCANPSAERLVVLAQVDTVAGWEGLGAFVVERSAPGLSVGARARTLGLLTVEFAPVSLENCYVPDAARLVPLGGTREGLRRLFAGLQVRSAARLVGLARASYEYAREFCASRVAFGKPIAHFQAVAFMLAEMHMDVESARWLVWRAAGLLDAQERPYREAAAAFSHAADYAQRVAERALQLLGGAGYLQDHPVEKWMRDAKTLSLFGCSAEAARQVVAEEDLGHGESAPLADLLPTPDIQAVLT